MKIYIWQGDGISGAYHDDGTLVVLANTAQEARELMLRGRAKNNRASEAIDAKAKELGFSEPYYWRQKDEAGFKEYYDSAHADNPSDPAGQWDGTEEALAREPDEVIELDEPKFIAFNGGGYD